MLAGPGVVVERSLLHGKLPDLAAELDGRFKGEGCPEGVTVDVGRPAGFIDQCRDVLDLPLDRIGPGVPALTAASTVIAVYREVRREEAGQLRLAAGAVRRFAARLSTAVLPVKGALRASLRDRASPGP